MEGVVSSVAGQLIGVIADLFESHQIGQHQTLALNAVGVLQLLDQGVCRLLVELCLRFAQSAKNGHFGFFGQVGNDGFVGFKPPQNVGADQSAQRCIVVVMAGLNRLGKG